MLVCLTPSPTHLPAHGAASQGDWKGILPWGVCHGGTPGHAAKVASRNSCPFPWLLDTSQQAAGLRETVSTLVIRFDAQMKEAMLMGTVLALKAVPAREGPPSVPSCPVGRHSCPLFMSHSRLKLEKWVLKAIIAFAAP